jgi:hypothetical protein
MSDIWNIYSIIYDLELWKRTFAWRESALLIGMR